MRRTTVVLTLTLLLGGSAGLAAQAPDSTAGPDSLRSTAADSTGEVKGDGSRRAARGGRAGREGEGPRAGRGARRGGRGTRPPARW